MLCNNSQSVNVGVDLREQLVNDNAVGPISDVSIPADMITSLAGILLDVDLKLLRRDALPPGALSTPLDLYQKWLQTILDRSPVLRHAEVRDSGNGLHVIIRFDPRVTFESDVDRQKWAAVARVLQSMLPTDPNCPGITALTRPLGSVNCKNGATVTQLTALSEERYRSAAGVKTDLG